MNNRQDRLVKSRPLMACAGGSSGALDGAGDALLLAVTASLHAWDPVRIGFVDDHEYDPEAKIILELLPEATSAQEVQRIVHTVFCRQFGDDIAGAIEGYHLVAARIWREWQDSKSTEL